MATPFQERSPCQTASYPRPRRACAGNAPGSALSSWRLTTSGSALASQASRLSSRLLMLLMLKVASFNSSLSTAVALGAPPYVISLLQSTSAASSAGSDRALYRDSTRRATPLLDSRTLLDAPEYSWP